MYEIRVTVESAHPFFAHVTSALACQRLPQPQGLRAVRTTAIIEAPGDKVATVLAVIQRIRNGFPGLAVQITSVDTKKVPTPLPVLQELPRAA